MVGFVDMLLLGASVRVVVGLPAPRPVPLSHLEEAAVPTDLTGRSVLFVGVGAMGRPMAARLASAGAALRVADADPDRARAVAGDLGASSLAVAGLASAAATADDVVLMLPDSTVVEDVLVGPAGLLDDLRPGSRVVDMSSSRPASTVALAAQRGAGRRRPPRRAGVRRGGPRRETGELSIMVGADEAAYADALPLLEPAELGPRRDPGGACRAPVTP